MSKSPFPGLDPYLERSWRGAHTRFITYITELMRGRLPEGLRSRIEQTVTLEETDAEEGPERKDYYVPDVLVAQRTDYYSPWSGGYVIRQYDPDADPETGDVLTIEAVEERPTGRFIEVRDTRDGNRLVTTIEFLSPSNKTRAGADEFRRKQRNLHRAAVNLVEIDLIRDGWLALFQPEGSIGLSHGQHCYVCITAVWWRGKSQLHRFGVRHRLPTIRVPLRPGDAPLAINLQELHDMVYDRGDYALDIDYTKEPEPPLSEDDAKWADAMLREKGLRP